MGIDMTLRTGLLSAFLLLLGPDLAATEKSGTISQSETWSGEINITADVTIDRAEVVVSPGTAITFAGKGKITVKTGAFLRCQGTEKQPIRWAGPAEPASVNVSGGRASLTFCRMSQVSVHASYPQAAPPILTLEDCVLIEGELGCWGQAAVVRRCYVSATKKKGSYAVVEMPPESQVSDNIFEGGSWVSKSMGGTITGNVFISQVVPAGGNVNDCTHEHICGLHPKARLERNIFIGNSYSAIMSIGAANGDGALIRNNTIDMRGKGSGYTAHLTKPKPQGIVLRNNLFLRCQGINDEEKTPDAIVFSDYNLFVAAKSRHQGVVMTARKPGDEGAEKHSVDVADPAGVCVDPEFGHPFPYSAEQMLSGAASVAEVLQRYRAAYAPKPGSPLIDAGSPEDAADAADGHCDIGAVERIK
jgi:hypothetical protein